MSALDIEHMEDMEESHIALQRGTAKHRSYPYGTQINEDNRYIHDLYISMWVLSMFYIQKMR